MGWSSVRRQRSVLRGPWGQDGEPAPASAGVYGRGQSRKRVGDDNEAANCFHWILKLNLSPQCTGRVARKWNIDDRSENKGK